jgi:hypothetical protein
MTLVMAARLNGGGEQTIDPGFTKMVQLSRTRFGWKSSGPENNNLVAQGEAGVTLRPRQPDARPPEERRAGRLGSPERGGRTLPADVPARGRLAGAGAGPRLRHYVLGTDVQTKFANDLLLAVTNRNVVLDPASPRWCRSTADLLRLGHDRRAARRVDEPLQPRDPRVVVR